MKKKILRVITRLNIGGPAIQAIDLSVRLKKFGYETILVYGPCNKGEKEIDKKNELILSVMRHRFFMSGGN